MIEDFDGMVMAADKSIYKLVYATNFKRSILRWINFIMVLLDETVL